jgi:hypothetical protein
MIRRSRLWLNSATAGKPGKQKRGATGSSIAGKKTAFAVQRTAEGYMRRTTKLSDRRWAKTQNEIETNEKKRLCATPGGAPLR